MKLYMLAKVHGCSVNNEPKDLEKGLGFVCVIESTKRIGDLEVPDFQKAKSAIKLENGEHLVEIQQFHIPAPGGRSVSSYTRILKKADLGAKK